MPGRGDYTGRTKEVLQTRHAEEQERAAQQMAMVTAAEQRERSTEVVDYTKAPPPPPPPAGPVDYTNTGESDEDDDPTIRAIVDGAEPGGGPVDPTAVDEVSPVAATPDQQPAPVRVEQRAVLIRSRYDLENVTVGHGTNYDFEEGRQYRVPPGVAEHLGERGLVDVLQ